MVEDKKDFESYLISALNDSLIKKSSHNYKERRFFHVLTIIL